ncbi:MAG: hypothetical protein OWS74_08575 [Firmicutes bacterium]|nr:hypothetical protein [Bacillota bacterium]
MQRYPDELGIQMQQLHDEVTRLQTMVWRLRYSRQVLLDLLVIEGKESERLQQELRRTHRKLRRKYLAARPWKVISSGN